MKEQNNIEIPEIVKKEQEAGRKVLMITSDDGEMRFFFKLPKKAQLDRFLTKSMKGKTTSAVEGLIQDLILEPDYNTFKQLSSEKPMRLIAISNVLQEELGLNEEYAVKKL